MNNEEIKDAIKSQLKPKEILGFEENCISFVSRNFYGLRDLKEYYFNDILHSQRGRLYLEIANATGAHLQNTCASSDEKIIWETFEAADDLASQIIHAFYITQKKNGKELEDWSYTEIHEYGSLSYNIPAQELQYYFEKNSDRISGHELSSAVSDYLSSPFRTPYLDRLLFTGLADAEIGSFIRSQVHPSHTRFLNGTGESQIKLAFAERDIVDGPHFGKLFQGLIKLTLLIVSLYFVWFYFNLPYKFIPHICSAVFGVIWITSVIYLRKKRREWINDPEYSTRAFIRLVTGFEDFYRLLHDPGDISIKVIFEDLERLKSLGAIMPPSLWVILEDIKEKGNIKLSWR